MVVGIVANGFVKALVAGTVANGFEKVGFVVLGGDDFETVENGFVSALVAETIANGFEKVGVVVIGDGFFKSATDFFKPATDFFKPSRMGSKRLGLWLSTMAFFKSVTASSNRRRFLQIGD